MVINHGNFHTVLLRSDGRVAACGKHIQVPALPEGVSYLQVAAGGEHTVFLRSDGTAVGCGLNFARQIDIPTLSPHEHYIVCEVYPYPYNH